MARLLKLTSPGSDHAPTVPHNIAAWGAVKELIRLRGGAATETEILAVLAFCLRDDGSRPNAAYLGYAERQGWLEPA